MPDLQTHPAPPLPDHRSFRSLRGEKAHRTSIRRRRFIRASLTIMSLGAAFHVPLPHATVMPGTSVAGVAVAGRTGDEVTAVIRQAANTLGSRSIVLVHGPDRFTVAAADVGFEVDVNASANAVMRGARVRNLGHLAWAHLTSRSRQVEIPLVTTAPGAATAVDTIADHIDRSATAGDVVIAPSLEVTVTDPEPGVTVDRDAAVAALERALAAPSASDLELPMQIVQPPGGSARLEMLAARIRAALAAPIHLRALGQTVTIQPAALASLIAVHPDQRTGEPTLAIDEDRLAELSDTGARPLARPAVEARLEPPQVPPIRLDAPADTEFTPVPANVTIVESQLGYEFEPRLVAEQLADMILRGERDDQLALRAITPEISTGDARAFGVTHLIGTFTTAHPCCQNRVHNIQLLADQMDGTVIHPEETFSINQLSGERTCAKGYRKDGMIQGGRLVSVCGGGVSQVGTTTMNAAFFAGLPIVQFKPHSWYIARYPMGREATLNYPTIDVSFTNDTGRPVVIRTSYTDTSITVSLYGTNTGRTVRAIHGTPANHRPPPTRVIHNAALPPGTTRTIQAGAPGFDITVTRTITEPGSTSSRWSYTAVYVPQPRIIETGATAAVQP